MTTPSVFDESLVQELTIFALIARTVIGVTALLAYSHLLTFRREVDFIWRAPKRPASWLYILIRYPALITQLIDVSLNSYTPGCSAVLQLAGWATTIAMGASYAFQILRTYAIHNRGPVLAVVLTVACLPAMAIHMFENITFVCPGGTLKPSQENTQLISDTVFESLVFLVTVRRTWTLAWKRDGVGIPRNSLVQLIFRNGLVYFALFFTLTLIQLVLGNLSATPSSTPSQASIFAAGQMAAQINTPLRWILLSQFILELRERAQNGPNTSIITVPNVTALSATINFIRTTVDVDFGDHSDTVGSSSAPLNDEHIGLEELRGRRERNALRVRDRGSWAKSMGDESAVSGY